MPFEQITHSWLNDTQREKITIVISSRHLSSRVKFYAPVDICNGSRIKTLSFTCQNRSISRPTNRPTIDGRAKCYRINIFESIVGDGRFNVDFDY